MEIRTEVSDLTFLERTVFQVPLLTFEIPCQSEVNIGSACGILWRTKNISSSILETHRRHQRSIENID